jgi:hypothetical protein
VIIGYFNSNYACELCNLSQNAVIPQSKGQLKSTENFQTFIKNFFSDSIFQKSRIKFPLNIYDLDRNKLWAIILKEPADTLKILVRNKWDFFSSLATDSLQYEVKIKFTNNRVIYVERGINFGISTIYNFKNINNKWFLIRLEYINI